MFIALSGQHDLQAVPVPLLSCIYKTKQIRMYKDLEHSHVLQCGLGRSVTARRNYKYNQLTNTLSYFKLHVLICALPCPLSVCITFAIPLSTQWGAGLKQAQSLVQAAQ